MFLLLVLSGERTKGGLLGGDQNMGTIYDSSVAYGPESVRSLLW